jgi:hypothetical protein
MALTSLAVVVLAAWAVWVGVSAILHASSG